MAELSTATAASALDGTELVPVSQGGAFRKATGTQLKTLANTLDTPITIAVNTTLSSTHYGKIVYVNTTAVVLTFPAAPATTEVLKAYNGAAGNITVNSVTVGAGKDITFISVGSAWKRMYPQIEAATSTHPGYKSTRWYTIEDAVTGSATGQNSLDRLWFRPFMVPQDVTISELGMYIATAVGAATFQCGIYASDVTDLFPTGNALTGTTSLSAATVAAVSDNVTDISLTAGVVYWFGYWASSTGVFYRMITGTPQLVGLVGAKTAAETFGAGGGVTYFSGGTFGTLPDVTAMTFAADGVATNIPAWFTFRAA